MSEIRIRRPVEQEKIYSVLTDKNEYGVFSTYKDVFMLGLMIGFIEQKRLHFTKSLERIQYNVFNEDTDEAVMNLIAFIESNDFHLVYSEENELQIEKFTIIEEYAAAGTEILYKKILEDETNPLGILTDYLLGFEENIYLKQEDNIGRISNILMDFK